MAIIYWSALLTAFIAFRFRKRFNAEFRRQQMITWPTVRVLTDNEHLQLRKEEGRTTYAAELDEDYHFFTHGKRYTGQQLIGEEIPLSTEQKTIITKRLNEQRSQLTARFNPAAPEENMLRVGHSSLGWGKVLVYAFFGVVLPTFFAYSSLEWATDPATWWETVKFYKAG
jgi:hypothetical protein